MRHLIRLVLFLLSFSVLVFSQYVPTVPSPFSPLVIGIHGFHNNGATTATTVVLSGSDWSGSNATPTAGSTIYCAYKSSFDGTWVTISDNVNSGQYQGLNGRMVDNTGSFVFSTFYKENTASSALTITATSGSYAHQQLACWEIKNTPLTYVLDSNVIASQYVSSGTNPNSGTSITPSNKGDMIVSAYEGNGTPTAGTNYTISDSAGALFPEYWVQGAATATTGPFTLASNSGYVVNMGAFGQQHAGTCDSTEIIDWSGGTNGSTPTATTLQSGTHGGAAQPNVNYGSNSSPGWYLAPGGASGITYSTSAYQPLATTRTCPYYTGTGSGSPSLGLSFASSGGSLQGVNYKFVNKVAQVSMGVCVSTTETGVDNQSIDLFSIRGGDFSETGEGNTDYVLVQMNGGGSSGSGLWKLEFQGGPSINGTTHWLANTQYWLQLVYVQAGDHYVNVYQGCGSSPTFKEKITANAVISGGAPADTIVFVSGNMTYPTGLFWYFGASAIDLYYGGAEMP